MIPVKVKVDAELAKEVDLLLAHTGVSGLSSTTMGVLESWIEPLHYRNVSQWLRAFVTSCAERSYTNGRLIPFSLVAPAARAAAEEDDAGMLELHAQLLAGFRNADRAEAPNKTFIAILSEMRPLDYQVIRYLLSDEPLIAIKEQLRHGGVYPESFKQFSLKPLDVAKALGSTELGVVLAAQNLARLGCIRVVTVPSNRLGPSSFPLNPAGCQLRDGETIYVPVELAIALLDALDEPTVDAETFLREPTDQT